MRFILLSIAFTSLGALAAGAQVCVDSRNAGGSTVVGPRPGEDAQRAIREHHLIAEG